MADFEDKLIEIPDDNALKYKAGEQVEVMMQRSSGSRAVVLAYIIPLMVMVPVLFITYSLSRSEAIAGLSALGGLAAYYFILSFFSKRLKEKLRISIKGS